MRARLGLSAKGWTHPNLLKIFSFLLCCQCVLTVPAIGQSLREAMIAAYRNNPLLQSQRLQTRAVDEHVPQALSGYRPKVSGEGFYGITSRDAKEPRVDQDAAETYGYSLKVEQPLFDGFRTRNSVREAESKVRGSRHDLRAKENDLLFETASVYFDVLRAEGNLLYRRKALTAMRRELVGAQERVRRGQSSITDLEQSRQRAALARSEKKKAAAELRVSQLRFVRITAIKPRSLRMVRLPTPHLPRSLRQAINLAETNSPIIGSADSRTEAARHAANRARGELLPSATIVGIYDRSFNSSTGYRDEEASSVVGRIRVPLFQGGQVYSRVRQAKSRAASLDRAASAAKLRVGEAVGAAWTEFKTARQRLSIESESVKAGERALAGVKEEHQAGRRTLLDVLDAERELVDARIRLLSTKRDLQVGAYALLRATGSLTVGNLYPGAERYDPKAHYRAVRKRWWGVQVPTSENTVFLGREILNSPHATYSDTEKSHIGLSSQTATAGQTLRSNSWQAKVSKRQKLPRQQE
ncbi:MAG: TolC family outer membrane protein [Pseudomonadota bacterium]